jgi:uncharacterized protein YecE (DUF72 family)
VHPVRIGTCGWSYKEWSGVVYPEGTAAADFLSCYAERYPVVEVDSTFYRTPSRKMVEGWRDKTPDGFGFSLKVLHVITHEKVLHDCRTEVSTFLSAARVLGPKLLCCVLQFGYYNRKAFTRLGAFLERLQPFLEAWPADVPLAVEVRNKTWMTTELGDSLRAHQAAWVLPDQAWMPSPLSIVRKVDAVTGPFAYVRLLGDRAAVDALSPQLDHTVIDRTDQIRTDAEAVRLLSERVPDLVFVNDHFAGYAPATARQLREALGVRAPGEGRVTLVSFRKEDAVMNAHLARSVLAVSLLTGAACAAHAQEKAEPNPEAPKEVRAVRYAMPVLDPLKPTAEWAGYVLDPKLRAAAPEADRVIVDAAAWAKVWSAWRGQEPLPEVNFKEEVLFVFTAVGPNIPCLKLYCKGANVGGTVFQTVKGGPGFGYRIIKVSRKETNSLFGRPIDPSGS